MKEDITQHLPLRSACTIGCGLVMKEDITQPRRKEIEKITGCGLVMKEDITQLCVNAACRTRVVVW